MVRPDPTQIGFRYADKKDSALFAGYARHGGGLLELRMKGEGGGVLREGFGLPRRRLGAEPREPLL
jgi:hypothetical protein